MKPFADDPKFQSRFRRAFYLILVMLLAADLVLWAAADRPVHFAWEGVPFFYGVYGFSACVGLIFAARLLRLLVGRKEGYYE